MHALLRLVPFKTRYKTYNAFYACILYNQLNFIVTVGGMDFFRLLRLLDRRYRGIAHGVGQSEILGRIHVAPIKVINGLSKCAIMQVSCKLKDIISMLNSAD